MIFLATLLSPEQTQDEPASLLPQATASGTARFSTCRAAYDLVGTLALPSGLDFALHHHGHCEGTAHWPPWQAPQRDDPWTDPLGFDDFIRTHWAEIVSGQAQWTVPAQATDKLVGGIEDWIQSVAQQALDDLGQEAASAGAAAAIVLIF